MGLGGAAEGGATAYAWLLLGGAMLVGLVACWLLWVSTGRRRLAGLLLALWTVGVAWLPVSAYVSEEAREDRAGERRTSDLLDEVLAAADQSDERVGTVLGRIVCDGDRTGWRGSIDGDTGSPDVLDRYERALQDEGFETSRGEDRRPGPRGSSVVVGERVLGERGSAGALVTQETGDRGTGRYVVLVEDGCVELDG